MSTGREEFKKFLVSKLQGLPRGRQRIVVDEFMEVIKEALGELGIGVVVESMDVDMRELKSPEHMKEFMDMLKRGGVKTAFEGIKSVRDHEVKNIGDAVVVTDRASSFYMHDYETKEQLSKDFETPKELFLNVPAIVIESGLEFVFNCGHCEHDHQSDLVVYFPDTEKKYYIASNLVRIL